ncbi:hypothetical protein BCAR13_70011 [Paraburkholderia caribensis]|nr:hypothetical protein BCAR13_70011 [Paraburkholderia caribensis]
MDESRLIWKIRRHFRVDEIAPLTLIDAVRPATLFGRVVVQHRNNLKIGSPTKI